MYKFKIDVYAWIPQAEVPNPLHFLPGGTGTWGPGACGPHFGGDDFVTPPPTALSWCRTFRAKQEIYFEVNSFGDRPSVIRNAGVVPGLTTVLSAPRSAGGTVCHSLTASVMKSSGSVEWSADDEWYEVKMHGEAQDPVPAATGGHVGGSIHPSIESISETIGSRITPNLEWKLELRLHRSGPLGLLSATNMRYALMSDPVGRLDVAAKTFPSPKAYAGVGHLLHGLIKVRRFPSYVVYVTIESGTGGAICIPVYFADASRRNLLEIGLAQQDPLRRLVF